MNKGKRINEIFRNHFNFKNIVLLQIKNMQ